MTTKKTRIKKPLLIILLVIVLLALGCTWYLTDYYHADIAAIEKFTEIDFPEHFENYSSKITVSREVLEDGSIAYIPSEVKGGFIFYPGGKVEHTAYEPLMMTCARRGVLCVLVEMPFRLAVFDMNAADGIQALYPQVENWYIGGHSLGGSMAASYIANHTEEYNGLILCASYSTADLSSTDLEILSLYGDKDGVLNMDKLKKYASNIKTDDSLTCIISNGNHAFFGMYGPQAGDGESSIGNTKQIFKAADWIVRTITE